MPLPDAKPDRRIYELLKTTDLENLTFSDFQKVAQTIYAEQGAEDELRRIVLVNLARLSVAGEWSGLTSAGGTPLFNYQIPDPHALTGGTYYAQIPMATPYASSNSAISHEVPWDSPFYVPFVSPKTGSLASMTVDIQTAQSGQDLDVGIYSVTSGGIPNALLGKVTFDASSTGQQTVTSFSSTITLEAGTTYCLAWVRSTGSSTAFRIWSLQNGNGPLGVNTSIADIDTVFATDFGGTSQALPASPSASDFISVGRTVLPIIGLRWS